MELKMKKLSIFLDKKDQYPRDTICMQVPMRDFSPALRELNELKQHNVAEWADNIAQWQVCSKHVLSGVQVTNPSPFSPHPQSRKGRGD